MQQQKEKQTARHTGACRVSAYLQVLNQVLRASGQIIDNHLPISLRSCASRASYPTLYHLQELLSFICVADTHAVDLDQQVSFLQLARSFGGALQGRNAAASPSAFPSKDHKRSVYYVIAKYLLGSYFSIT